ncbi:MAG: GNAT family acetyltransferase [Pseudomonadales bacterium]|nr:GNAT family acetyltransferase [Pseudomonadales bacterium]
MATSADLQVRAYRESDRAALIRLWEVSFPDDPPHNAPAANLDRKLARDDLVFVVLAGDKLIGGCMAGWDGHRGWVYSVAVSPAERGTGAGRRLMSHVEAVLASKGCTKLNLQVRSTNSDVIRFYESLGFSVEERVSMGKKLG